MILGLIYTGYQFFNSSLLTIENLMIKVYDDTKKQSLMNVRDFIKINKERENNFTLF